MGQPRGRQGILITLLFKVLCYDLFIAVNLGMMKLVSPTQSGADGETDSREDLAYIRNLMQETHRSAAISGPLMVIWGALDGLGYLAQWWMERHQVSGTPTAVMWMAALIAGCVLAYRQKRFQAAWSPTGRTIIALWIASWISISLIYFAGGTARPGDPKGFPGIEAAIIAVPVVVTGLVAEAAWLRNSALVWWAASALMLIQPGSYSYLLMAGLYFSLFVVPGLLLVTGTAASPPAS